MAKRDKCVKTHTRFGTPLSPGWDGVWAGKVEALEVELNRRICGGRALDGAVCRLFSNHASGRCRFHVGVDGVGGQAGNRNAVLHGFFSRRLQDCGPHCSRFERCPVAGPDVAELPAKGRPACPFELAEYDALVADLAGGVEGNEEGLQLAEHVALLQVMVGRAARALAAGGEEANLGAFLRLSGEYRRGVRMLSQAAVEGRARRRGAEGAGGAKETEEVREFCLADSLRPLLKRTEGILEECLVADGWEEEENYEL